jgi:uncharacterized Zn finger protein
MSDFTTVILECPCCGEQSNICQEYVIIAPAVEIRCPECGTLWMIEGLVEIESNEDDK